MIFGYGTSEGVKLIHENYRENRINKDVNLVFLTFIVWRGGWFI